MIQYKHITITNASGQTVVNVLAEQDLTNVSINAISINDLSTLIINYIDLLQRCPDYTLQTPELVKKSSNSNNNNHLFTPICGGLTSYAIEYFDLIKILLEKRVTNAFNSNSLENLQTERALLQQLHQIVANILPRNNVITKGNPATLKSFLTGGINAVNDRINAFTQAPQFNQ